MSRRRRRERGGYVRTHTLRVFARGGSPALELHAAVYCEVYAGYVAAFFGAEEEGGSGAVFGFTGETGGNACHYLRGVNRVGEGVSVAL